MESISRRRIDGKLLLSDSPAATNHPRRLSRSSTGHNPLQTPPAAAAYLTKTRSSSIHNQRRNVDEWDCGSISCELQALAKMMHDEFGVSDSVDFENGVPLISSPLFERGRFYEEYSARRNERLKSKKGVVAMDEKKNRCYDLGVRAESSKRRDSKKFEGLMKKKSNPITPPKPKTAYSLRSVTKENKRLSLPLSLTASVGVERKMAAARVVRKF